MSYLIIKFYMYVSTYICSFVDEPTSYTPESRIATHHHIAKQRNDKKTEYVSGVCNVSYDFGLLQG